MASSIGDWKQIMKRREKGNFGKHQIYLFKITVSHFYQRNFFKERQTKMEDLASDRYRLIIDILHELFM